MKDFELHVPIRGEAAQRISEFQQLCTNQKIDYRDRISALILGDILMYKKLNEFGGN